MKIEFIKKYGKDTTILVDGKIEIGQFTKKKDAVAYTKTRQFINKVSKQSK